MAPTRAVWEPRPGTKELRERTVTALVARNPFRMGYDDVNAAVREIREGSPDGDTGSILATRENLDDEEIQAVLNPSCDSPPTDT